MTAVEPDFDAEALEGTDTEHHTTEAIAFEDATHQGVIVPPDNLPAIPVPESGMLAGNELTIVPLEHELDRLAQLAVTIAGAATAPKALQGKPNDVFMVLLTARDLGVALTTAIREFHVIDGKVTLSPKVRKAMVNQKGIGRVWKDEGNNAETATWYAIRNDLPGVVQASTYTMEMARRVPKLLDKQNWTSYPERMLSWRALGYLLDDVFSEVGTGLYSPDELGAVTDEEGEPVIDVVAHAEPVRGTRAPAGHNQAPPPLLSDEQRAGLQTRIDAIEQHSKMARDVLLTLWTARDDGGSPKLGPLNRVWASEFKIADAIVASIEARIKKGEWAPVTPDDDTAGTDTPEDAPAAPQDDSGPVTPDPDGPTVEEMATETVEALSDEMVVSMLAEGGQPVGGTKVQRRVRLVQMIVAEENTVHPPADDPAPGTMLPMPARR